MTGNSLFTPFAQSGPAGSFGGARAGGVGHSDAVCCHASNVVWLFRGQDDDPKHESALQDYCPAALMTSFGGTKVLSAMGPKETSVTVLVIF